MALAGSAEGRLGNEGSQRLRALGPSMYIVPPGLSTRANSVRTFMRLWRCSSTWQKKMPSNC